MNNELLMTMHMDMKISQYSGESDEQFTGRVVYSALCHWMRYCIFDELTDYRDYKSKKYILERGQELLCSYIECIPSCKKWLCYDRDNEISFSDTVKIIRDRMLYAGEFLEVDFIGNLGLPVYDSISKINNHFRVVGITPNKITAKHVGITRIVQATNTLDIQSDFIEHTSPIELINWLKESLTWVECPDLNRFEFFNPYSKKSPYQSWGSNPINNMELHLARMTVYNEQKEYYLFYKNGERWLYSILPLAVTKYKESRRIILGLRELCNNKMEAYYSKKNEVVLLYLYSRLPYKEEHILETYCWPMRTITDKLNYVVPIEVWDTIKGLLQNDLAINLKE